MTLDLSEHLFQKLVAAGPARGHVTGEKRNAKTVAFTRGSQAVYQGNWRSGTAGRRSSGPLQGTSRGGRRRGLRTDRTPRHTRNSGRRSCFPRPSGTQYLC